MRGAGTGSSGGVLYADRVLVVHLLERVEARGCDVLSCKRRERPRLPCGHESVRKAEVALAQQQHALMRLVGRTGRDALTLRADGWTRLLVLRRCCSDEAAALLHQRRRTTLLTLTLAHRHTPTGITNSTLVFLLRSACTVLIVIMMRGCRLLAVDVRWGGVAMRNVSLRRQVKTADTDSAPPQ